MSLLQSKIPGLNCNDVFKILTQFENHLYKYVKSQKRQLIQLLRKCYTG